MKTTLTFITLVLMLSCNLFAMSWSDSRTWDASNGDGVATNSPDYHGTAVGIPSNISWITGSCYAEAQYISASMPPTAKAYAKSAIDLYKDGSPYDYEWCEANVTRTTQGTSSTSSGTKQKYFDHSGLPDYLVKVFMFCETKSLEAGHATSGYSWGW